MGKSVVQARTICFAVLCIGIASCRTTTVTPIQKAVRNVSSKDLFVARFTDEIEVIDCRGHPLEIRDPALLQQLLSALKNGDPVQVGQSFATGGSVLTLLDFQGRTLATIPVFSLNSGVLSIGPSWLPIVKRIRADEAKKLAAAVSGSGWTPSNTDRVVVNTYQLPGSESILLPDPSGKGWFHPPRLVPVVLTEKRHIARFLRLLNSGDPGLYAYDAGLRYSIQAEFIRGNRRQIFYMVLPLVSPSPYGKDVLDPAIAPDVDGISLLAKINKVVM